MHQGIKTLFVGSLVFFICSSLSSMSLIEKAPNDVLFSIAHLLTGEEESFDYYNCTSKEHTHTQQTFELFKKYERNVTGDYIYLMMTCKRMYALLNIYNRLPTHLSWSVFIKSMYKNNQNNNQSLKITSHHANVNEKYNLELISFGRYILWKLTCDFFKRTSRQAISKNALLERSFIDKQSPLWDVLNFAKRNSVVGTVLVESFANLLNDDNENKCMQFVCLGSFDWLNKGVSFEFVKKYFLYA